MIIRETIDIHAPLEHVWHVFSRIEEWGNWNAVCRECGYVIGNELARGTCFSFVLRPYHLPLKVIPKVVKCDPGKEVVWEGSRLGIHAHHRFVFEQKSDFVVLTSIETFQGPLLWLCKRLGIPSRLHRLSRQLMAAIKQQAEYCAGQNGKTSRDHQSSRL